MPDVNPIAYLSKHVNRIPIIHLKQMENPDTKKNVPAPDGYIDMAKIMIIAPNAHYVYEQEYSDTIMKDMEKSLKHLKGLNE